MADRRLELSINLKVETERAKQQLASLGAVPLRVDMASAINQLKETRIPVQLDSSGMSGTGNTNNLLSQLVQVQQQTGKAISVLPRELGLSKEVEKITKAVDETKKGLLGNLASGALMEFGMGAARRIRQDTRRSFGIDLDRVPFVPSARDIRAGIQSITDNEAFVKASAEIEAVFKTTLEPFLFQVGDALTEGILSQRNKLSNVAEDSGQTFWQAFQSKIDTEDLIPSFKKAGIQIGDILSDGIAQSLDFTPALSSLDRTLTSYKTRALQQIALPQVLDRARELTESGKAPRVDDSTDEAIFVTGGYAGMQGRSGLRIARQLQQDLPNTSKVVHIPNRETDIPDLGENVSIEMIQAARASSLAIANLRGYTKDAIEMAAQALAAYQRNQSIKIKLLGESGGGFVAEEASAILKMLGVENVEFLGAGTPKGLGAFPAGQGQRVLSPDENLGEWVNKIGRPRGVALQPEAEPLGASAHRIEGYYGLAEVANFIRTPKLMSEEELQALREGGLALKQLQEQNPGVSNKNIADAALESWQFIRQQLTIAEGNLLEELQSLEQVFRAGYISFGAQEPEDYTKLREQIRQAKETFDSFKEESIIDVYDFINRTREELKTAQRQANRNNQGEVGTLGEKIKQVQAELDAEIDQLLSRTDLGIDQVSTLLRRRQAGLPDQEQTASQITVTEKTDRLSQSMEAVGQAIEKTGQIAKAATPLIEKAGGVLGGVLGAVGGFAEEKAMQRINNALEDPWSDQPLLPGDAPPQPERLSDLTPRQLGEIARRDTEIVIRTAETVVDGVRDLVDGVNGAVRRAGELVEGFRRNRAPVNLGDAAIVDAEVVAGSLEPTQQELLQTVAEVRRLNAAFEDLVDTAPEVAQLGTSLNAGLLMPAEQTTEQIEQMIRSTKELLETQRKALLASGEMRNVSALKASKGDEIDESLIQKLRVALLIVEGINGQIAQAEASIANVRYDPRFEKQVQGVRSEQQQLGTLRKRALESIAALTPAVREAAEAGNDTAQGFIFALESALPRVAQTASRTAQQFILSIKRELGIASPSKVMQEVGRWVIEGLRLGVEKSNIKQIGQKAAQELRNGFGRQALNALGVEAGRSAKAVSQGLVGLTAVLPRTRQQLEATARAAGILKRGLDFLIANIKEIAIAYLAFSVFDPQALISFGQAAVQTAVRLEQLTTALNNSSGGAEQGAAQLAFVRAEVDRLALPLEASVQGFTQLSAATRGTSLEGEKTQQMFSALAQAGRVNALTQEQMQRVFLATSQVMSKGTVAAEELRGQIGEVLPGAYQTFAKALGISTEELSKRLEQGQVGIEDYYRFIQQLAAQTAGGVDAANQTAAASLQRLSTAWEKAMAGMGAAVLPAVSAIAGALVSGIEMAGNIAAGVGDVFSGLGKALYQAGRFANWLATGLDKLTGGALSAVGKGIRAVVTDARMMQAVFSGITIVVLGKLIPALVTFALTTIPTVITSLSALAVSAGLSLAALGPYALAVAAIAAAALAAKPALDGLADAMDGVNEKANQQGAALDKDYNAALDKLQRGVPLTAEALKSLKDRLGDTAINGGMGAKSVAILTQRLDELQARALRAAEIQAQINAEIAASEKAFKRAGDAIETSYLKAQAELIEAQNAGLINADRVRVETLELEQQKARDLIEATEKREAEITAIIQKYEFLRSVKGSLTDEERKKLEEQQEQLTQIVQQQYRARADIARRETEIANQVVIAAEKARNAEVERLRIDDLISAEQADLAILKSRRTQIEERIRLEGQTHDLVLELLDNERQQQEALTRAIQNEIQQRADAVKRGYEAEQLYYRENIIAIERQQTALDALTRVYEQQNQLLEARGSLAAAVRDLGEGEFDIRQKQLQEESKAIDEQAARLSEMATTDEERAAIQTSAEAQKKQIQEQSDALAKESARFRLQALQLEQAIEVQKLALQRQQNAAALERERIALRIAQAENQSAQAQNRADTAQTQADIAKIQSDRTLTPEQRDAALAAANLQLQANQIEGLALQDKNAALGMQGALIDQQAMVDQQVQAMQELTLNLQQLAQRRGLQQEAGLPVERMPGSPQELLQMSPQQLAAARGATAGQFVGQPQQLPGHRNLAMEAAAAAQQQHQALMRGIVPVSMLQSAPPVNLSPVTPGVNAPQAGGISAEVLNTIRQIFPPINQMTRLLEGINTATSATANRPSNPITIVQDALNRSNPNMAADIRRRAGL